MSITADRFVASGASWIDLASGAAVTLRTFPAPDRAAQIVWSARCAALERLRHPAICALLDHGALDAATLFEAYAVRSAIDAGGSTAARLREHAVQFLRSQSVDGDGVPFTSSEAAGAPRPRGRILGVVLHPRAVEIAVNDVLDGAGAGGTSLVTLAGAPGSGLRTLRTLVARQARTRGYVPVAAECLDSMPWLRQALLERHVCVLVDEPLRARHGRTLGAFLTALGCASTRRHVVLAFSRSARHDWQTLQLEPMGVRAMTAMVFGDAGAPSARELFDAARRAEGRPGTFLEGLRAYVFDSQPGGSSIAHETAEPYFAEGASPAVPTSAAAVREGGVLGRAVGRGDDLARRGRRLAAARLLERASRVLAARGAREQAAACAERLGRVQLDRGDTRNAIEAFERAQALAGDTVMSRQAALGLAGAWIEERRLVEAEALLRSLALSAALDSGNTPGAIAAALGRCLLFQERFDEAAAVLGRVVDAGERGDAIAVAAAAQVETAAGRPHAGVRLARVAVDRATQLGDDRGIATSEGALADALLAAGDHSAALEHASLGLAAARRAHLPLLALRARLTQLRAWAAAGGTARARRVGQRLLALANKRLIPPLLRHEIDIVTREGAGAGAAVFAPTMTELERLLEMCHTSADDRQALDLLCATLVQKLRAATAIVVGAADRRAMGHSGRPWSGESRAVSHAFAAGRGVPPDDRQGLLEAAEPVKYGGEVIAVLACRWVPGADVYVDRALALLRAAALAAAAPARGVLDRATPPIPGAAWSDLLGDSAPAAALREVAARAARAPFPVLIEGESGSGKEVIARAVHRLGPRRDRRFCPVNCAALSDELLEAELFGHTRGAFTGAVGERAGLFEEADGGTLFLDEIGELSARGQAKLLRVLQEGEIRRIGENVPRRVDVRIVAATNRDLGEEVRAGRFRADLRFRLDVVRIHVPPLRERVADIPLLATHFWEEAARRVGSRATLAPDTLSALARYDWPGNVRELQNVIAWMAVHSPRRGRVGAAALPASVAGTFQADAATFESAREEFERRFVRGALARANGHRSKAAESLGVSRQGLAKMMRRLRIDDRPFA